MNLIFNSQNLEIFGQLLLAVILGSLIGAERGIEGQTGRSENPRFGLFGRRFVYHSFHYRFLRSLSRERF